MTKIIGFGSFKQSGKSSSCQFLVDKISQIKKYTLIPRVFGGASMQNIGSEYSYKIYSFADKLKQFAIECLGLTYEQCYGTDDNKNSLSHLRWEDMPGVTCDSHYLGMGQADLPKELIYHESGRMTAREVLQYFGTNIGRRMYSNIWVDATIRQIKNDKVDFALLSDCRFKNEAEAIQKEGGRIIGLTRRPFTDDNHQSEIDLIGYPFDAEIDNTELTLEEKNQKVLDIIKMWRWL